MNYLPIILKKGLPFIETLSSSTSLQRAICPREKLISFIDGSGHLIVHLLSDEQQRADVDGYHFIKYQWVVPCRAQQDCVVDQKLEHKSELLALTSALECHWYSVSESKRPSSTGREEILREMIRIERLAVLKKVELCTKLRKLDFPDVLESVDFLGSDGGQVFLLLNSSLVCCLTLDQEFGCISLVCCYDLRLSLSLYQDDELPTVAGAIVSCAFINPLLFVVTANGIVFVYRASNGAHIGIINVRDYCCYNCSRQPESEELLSSVINSKFEVLSVSPDLTHLVVSSTSNHLVYINILDYYQIFTHHYHPDFIDGSSKSHHSYSSLSSQLDTSKEEENERKKYGAIPAHQQTVSRFPGHYTWMSRLYRLGEIVDDFQPEKMHYLNFQQSTELPRSTSTDDVLVTDQEIKALPSKSSWYERPQSAVTQDRQIPHSSFSTQFVTGIKPTNVLQKKEVISVQESLNPSIRHYRNHCILPAVPQKDLKIIRVDFVSGLVVVYYGQSDSEGDSKVSFTSKFCGPANGMTIYCTDSQSYSYVRLLLPSWLVWTSLPGQLVYFVSNQSLFVISFNLLQEEFVGKVLMFGSASVAEEVCRLNHWDKCSLPINALETALELRQLDTLAFFLQSDSINQESGMPSLPSLPSDQLNTVMQLLIGAIQRDYQEAHLCHFAGQLLIMALGFIVRVIKSEVIREGYSESDRGVTGETLTMEQDVHSSTPLMDLTSYIQQLRSFLPKVTAAFVRRGEEEYQEDVVTEERNEDYFATFMDQTLVMAWDKMNPKEVIKDGLLQGCLPLVQSYLFQQKPEGQKVVAGVSGFDTANQHGVGIAESLDDFSFVQQPYAPSFSFYHDASLHAMQVTAIGYVIDALQKRDIKLANSILMHLGLDVYSSLRHVCFHTLDRELRNFLSNELILQGQMNEAEISALEYLHVLEKYFSCQSYDQSHDRHSKQMSSSKKMSFQATILPTMPTIMSRTTAIPSLGNLQDLYPETFGGDIALHWEAPILPSTSQNLYLQVPLAAVIYWDFATRQRMLFEGFVLCGQTESVDCERLVKKKDVFDYYISHNDITNIMPFLTSRVPSLENSTICPSCIISFCSALPHATTFLRDALLDELARNGVFIPSELENFSLFLHRLGRVHSLFTTPHPLSKLAGQVTQCQDENGYSQLQSESALISVGAFHRKFLKYLVENRFYSLLYHYLDSYSLGLDGESIALLGLENVDQPWVDVLLQYRRAALNPLDPSVIFQASLSCGQLLLSSDHVPLKATVMGMLEDGRTLMAIATLMYAPVPLEEVISKENSHQPWHVEPSSLRQAIGAYPSLQAAIFPPLPTSLTPAQSQDITLYELLQDNVPFEIGSLFKWQDTNTVSSGHDDTIINTYDLPHFSHPALAEKYSLSVHLDYVYYLHKGQPSFAFANFVASKLLGHSNTAKRIDRLISRVYRLAMYDFTNSRLGSSCAALMEMLGRDSVSLQIDLQCANRIVKYGEDQREKDSMDDNHFKKTVSQFCHLHQTSNTTLASSLLTQLELATQTMVTNSGVEICGLEAEECWQLVQSFCHSHQLPPSVAFLTLCAENGQWLPLLCHAQLYCITTQKVMMIVDKCFSNPCVKEHLTLAISAMDNTDLPTSPLSAKSNSSTAEKPRSRRRRKSSSSRNTVTERAQKLISTHPDLRAKFYSRVGLQKEVSPQPEPKLSYQGVELRREERPSVERAVVNGQDDSPLPQKNFPPALQENDLPSDLFSAIFRSESHECSWRALLAHAIALQRPLLAILAACYEDSCAIDCTCAWLFSTLGSPMFKKLSTLLTVNGEISVSEDELRYSGEIQWRSWSTLDLSLMLISAMQHPPSPAAHFSLAFYYFDQTSPLLSFLRFHEHFVLRNDYVACKDYLEEFEVNMNKCKVGEFGGSIGDICWVEQVASSMASHMLVTCPTPFERSHLLQLLSEAHFGEKFKCSVLNFSDLHQMSCILDEAGLASDAAFTIKEHFLTVPGLKSLSEIHSVRVRVDTDYVLGLLLERGQFDIARKYASIVKSTASQVTIKEAEYNLNQLRRSSYWEYEQARLNFWHQCNSNFHESKVDPESAAEFFHSIVDNSEGLVSVNDEKPTPASITAMERALLLALALKWRKQSDVLNVEQIKDLEREIWVSHIHSAMEEMENSSGSKHNDSPLPFLSEVSHSTLSVFSSQPGHTSLLSSLSISSQQQFKGRRQLSEFMLPDNVSVAMEGKNRTTLTHKEGEAFDMMLGRLMNAGLLSQARELAATFEHDSPDLTIVLCCIQLSQGKLTPSQLTEGVLSLVSARPPRHLNDPSVTLLDDPNHSRQALELIRMMNTLSDRAIYARECCNCIITCFKIALALNLSYVSIITTDPFETLTQLLSCRASDRFILAANFITTCNIEAKEVAQFLSDAITKALEAQHREPGSPSDFPSVQIYQCGMSSSQFHELVQLISDPSLLGNILLKKAKSLASMDDESKQSADIQVELLIRAHDCYTFGCSVDGISDVLVVAQNWVERLVRRKHFNLMVRLLTGISRYHEMSYIIGLLIQHDQFESLVHTGVEKEEQLRVALIEYLRKHGSDDEKLQMVALKFGMFRELAKITEDRAKKDLVHIKSKDLTANNPETVKKLKVIFDGFKDAAKTYAKEDCLNNAEHCLSQARLVALQLSLLHQNKQVINLKTKAVLKYMEQQSFTEALIVSYSYKQCIWADWINPLYKHVIVGGDFHYLNEYKTVFPLTPTVFTELASKYQRDRERPAEATNNMKKLLLDLKDITLQQKLAMELGLKDVIQSKYDAGYMNDIQRL